MKSRVNRQLGCILVVCATLLLRTPAARSDLVAETVSVLRVTPQLGAERTSAWRESQSLYDTRRNTVATMLRLHLNRADSLAGDNLRELRIVNSKAAPQRWLAESIHVTVPVSTELIVVSLTHDDEETEDAAKLVDRLMERFVSEVKSVEYGHHVSKLDKLRKQYRVYFDDIKRKSDEVQQLGRQLGTLDNATIAAEQRIRMQELAFAKQEHDRLRHDHDNALQQLEQTRLHAQLEQAPAAVAIEDELEKDPQYHQLGLDLRAIKKHLAALSEHVRSGSPALEALHQELAILERQREGVREQLRHRVDARLRLSQHGDQVDQRNAQVLRQQVVDNLGRRVEAAQQAYQQQLAAVRELGGFSGDLDARTQELQSLRQALQRVRREMLELELELELETPLTVRVIQPAQRIIRGPFDVAIP